VTAFFYSSADAAQVQLSNAAEKAAKDLGKKISVIDGYKNARMTEKLGVPLPSVVELRKGTVSKATATASEADVIRAVS
jgi:thioredoxin reductase (NADPH)